MSFGGGKAPKEQSVNQTTTNIPDWAKDYATRMFTKGEAISNQPYVEYGGPRVAGLNGIQTGAANMQGAEVGKAGGLFDIAANRMRAVPQTFDQTQLDKYQNPYIKNVIDAMQGRAETDFARQQQGIAAGAVKAGGWGNTRFGVENAVNNSLFNRDMMEQRYKGLADSYDKSYSMFNTDRGAQIQEAQGLAGIAQNRLGSMTAGIDQYGNYGDQQQANTQQRYDTGYNDFVNQRDWQKNQLGWWSSLLHGYASTPNSDTVTSTYGGANGLESALGTGLGAFATMQGLK
jgi:hypothetical protein